MGITREIGAAYSAEKGTLFTVWAPEADQVEVVVTSPEKKTVSMQREAFGYWLGRGEDIKPGARYMYKLSNDMERPDPASRFQPEGVHKASEVVDYASFQWTDQQWKGIPLKELIIYELHVGTFTEEGTFHGIINKLPELKDLGINAIEIMPVAQFPGSRNWGYDGVYPFAVQDSYGGPEGLKELVNACHQEGISVVMDVVYNHMGPEGNYLNDYGPYFTDKYKTPWGRALNFDDAHSDHIRNFFFQNALMWLRDYHIDALRLDAVHAILDTGSKHFLQELQEHVEQLEEQQDRPYLLIAETDLNDPRLINPMDKGGYGLAGQWTDEFHHALHAFVTGETDGYYSDFGEMDHLVKTMKHAYVYDGLYSEHRKKTFGSDTAGNPAEQFVVCAQNHDQVGNRMLGERLTQLVSFEMLKTVAGVVLLSPYTPMLFMGEEYGEQNPFLYFISHTDKDLVEAVQKGRKEEFSYFSWKGKVPDPQSEKTFENSRLQRTYEQDETHNTLRELYKELIRLRKESPALKQASKENLTVTADADNRTLHMLHTGTTPNLYCILNFSKEEKTVTLEQPKAGQWNLILNTADTKWGGPQNESGFQQNNNEVTLQPESLLVLQSK